jgi:hypothetical protein
MPLFRRSATVPEPAPPPVPDPLAALSAVPFAIADGFWVYALHEAGGLVFYAGKSDHHLIRRLGDHIDTWGPRGTGRLAAISVVPCRDVHDMEVNELWLIKQLEKAGHPVINNIGTEQWERRRRARELQHPRSHRWLDHAGPVPERGTVSPEESNPSGRTA